MTLNANRKCVIVVDETMPAGIITNTAAILGMTLGKRLPEAVGEDLLDGDGICHMGIVQFPIPVLRGDGPSIREILRKVREEDLSDLIVVDFSDVAQGCRTYDEFRGKMAQASGANLNYLGIALCGDRKQINHLTGSMGLLR